jgi:release factor glutamine methyltransferase
LYDYIFANPPYVPEAQKAKVQKSVLDQEPHNAVFGGEDGLYYIRGFLREVKKYLAPGGVVFMEFDSQQRDIIKKLAKEAGASIVEMRNDQFLKWRYARIVF